MPKTAREAIRTVERDGWYHVRTKGGHRHFRHDTKPGTVTIPGKLGEDLKNKVWHNILKQAGLK